MSKKRLLFLENPYDIETLLESLKIATAQDKEFLFMDRLIATLRIDSEADLTNLNYGLLHDLNLLSLTETTSEQPQKQKE
jgi:hypothetical protein